VTHARHLPHKLLVALLLLAAFSLPFVLVGTGHLPDTTMVKAGAGVLNATAPEVHAEPSGNAAAVIQQVTGDSLSASAH
jgi:hypothetical protein